MLTMNDPQSIGVQINANIVYFGGEEPSGVERDSLRQLRSASQPCKRGGP
jgi:hypothetical protein